jgi:hypothetical protein
VGRATWVRRAGGVRPSRNRDLQGHYLSFGEREEIALGRAGGESIRPMSRPLGRSASAISRELVRNSDGNGIYRATVAHPLAYEWAGRPKPAKLVTNMVLRARVELDLEKNLSRRPMIGATMMAAMKAAATAREAGMGSQVTDQVMTAARFVLAALSGFVIAVIVILNLHILVGLEDGYASSPADVFEWSSLLAVGDIALLVAGPVLGIFAISRLHRHG